MKESDLARKEERQHSQSARGDAKRGYVHCHRCLDFWRYHDTILDLLIVSRIRSAASTRFLTESLANIDVR